MRKLFRTILLCAGLVAALFASQGRAGPSDGAVIGAVKVVDHGPQNERLNFVLVAEGYRQSELGKFASDAQGFVTEFFNTAPFSTNRTCFNFWRIDVASTESGADNPATCADGSTATPVFVATYFDATFCASGLRRLLGVNSQLVRSVVDELVPEWDAVLVIVNSTEYGGSGGQIATTSLAGSWHNIALHEFGHSGFGLTDEYDYWTGCMGDGGTHDYYSGAEPSAANATAENQADYVKWRMLFYPGIPIPTTVSTDCSVCDLKPDPFPGEVRVGLYEGAEYYHCGIYRPAYSCMMRNYAQFCPVCSYRIWQLLVPYQPKWGLPLLLSYNRVGTEFRVNVPTSMGTSYQLQYRNALATEEWTSLSAVPGNGMVVTLTDPYATVSQRFYRVRQW